MEAPAHPFPLWRPPRWMTWSAFGVGVLALLATQRRRRRRQPDVGRVSEAWLREYEYASGHHAHADV